MVVVCFILAAPTYRVISMWVMRELSAAEAVGALVVLLAFLAGIMTTWGRPINLLLWLLLILLAGAIWFAGKQHDRQRLDRFFREDVAASMRALAKDPTNAAAHLRLGQLYEARGDLDTAIQHFDAACRIVPRDSEARLALSNAIERKRREALHSLTCWCCGAENAATAAHCHQCGVLISDRNQIVEVLSRPPVVKAVACVAIGALALAVTGSFVRVIPLPVTVLAYLLLFLAAMCYVYPRRARARH